MFFLVCLMRRCVFLFILEGGGVVAEKMIFLMKKCVFLGVLLMIFFCLIAEKLRCFLFGC